VTCIGTTAGFDCLQNKFQARRPQQAGERQPQVDSREVCVSAESRRTFKAASQGVSSISDVLLVQAAQSRSRVDWP
jgi:hypothetical protein